MPWHCVDGIPSAGSGGGVYALYKDSTLIYVGRTRSFASRLPAHRTRFQYDYAKLSPLLSAWAAKWLERRLLRRLRPPCNQTIPRALYAEFYKSQISLESR